MPSIEDKLDKLIAKGQAFFFKKMGQPGLRLFAVMFIATLLAAIFIVVIVAIYSFAVSPLIFIIFSGISLLLKYVLTGEDIPYDPNSGERKEREREGE